MRESFKAALVSYPVTPHPADETEQLPRLSSADRAHLKRWTNDERVEAIWSTISSAVKKNGKMLPMPFFIQEVLGTRDIAKLINRARMQRVRYLQRAAQMEELAKFVQEPLMYGLPLIPTAAKISQMLKDVANTYRDHVAISRNKERGLNWTRQSKPSDVFMKQLTELSSTVYRDSRAGRVSDSSRRNTSMMPRSPGS